MHSCNVLTKKNPQNVTVFHIPYCIAKIQIIFFTYFDITLGMLIVGVLLRNIPGIKIVGESIDTKWSGHLR